MDWDPDLILLDLMLPDDNGYRVCETLRARNPVVPVIILTAKAQEADKVRGLEAGVGARTGGRDEHDRDLVGDRPAHRRHGLRRDDRPGAQHPLRRLQAVLPRALVAHVGAHLVDISPLSPLGAICLAYTLPGAGRQVLFSRLIWMGLAMCLLGAILCQALFGFFRVF